MFHIRFIVIFFLIMISYCSFHEIVHDIQTSIYTRLMDGRLRFREITRQHQFKHYCVFFIFSVLYTYFVFFFPHHYMQRYDQQSRRRRPSIYQNARCACYYVKMHDYHLLLLLCSYYMYKCVYKLSFKA